MNNVTERRLNDKQIKETIEKMLKDPFVQERYRRIDEIYARSSSIDYVIRENGSREFSLIEGLKEEVRHLNDEIHEHWRMAYPDVFATPATP